LFLQDKIYFSQIPDEMMVRKGKVINWSTYMIYYDEQ
jgi:hypothetical protein